MRQEWSPQPPGCDWSTSVSQFSRKPGLCENCSSTGPPVLLPIFARAKTATRLVHQCCCSFRAKWTIVVAVFAHGGASVVAFFARAKIATTLGGPVLSQFSRLNTKNATRMVPPAPGCAIFAKMRQEWSPQPRMCEKCNKNGPFCAKIAKPPDVEKCNNNGSICAKTVSTPVSPMCENCNNNGPFCAKIATTLVQMCEKCNNNGSICAKTVSTPVPHVRKVQQHWGQNVRKVCQGLNTIGIYGLGFRVRV